MSKVDELLELGVVHQDPDSEAKVIFNVALKIPKAAIEKNAFEVFAKEYGWQPLVPNPEDPGTFIDNPEKAWDKGISVIRLFAWGVLEAALIKQAQEQASILAKAQIEVLKSL